MTKMASPITSLTVVYSTVYSDADQIKHQSAASLAFVWGIHRDRWIPRTKGQLRGKCFQLITSSWDIWLDTEMVPWCQWVNEATVSYKQIVVFPVDVFWLPSPPQCWEILGNAQHNSVGKRLIFTYGGNAHIVRVLRSLLQNGLPPINTLLHVCIFSWSNTRVYSQTK